MGAANSQISQIGLLKGEGLRIINIRQNSPLDGKIQPFFDFIVDVISSKQPQSTPKQILGKLTAQAPQTKKRKVKSFNNIIEQNQNTQITLKIVSTKYRNPYNVQVIPNRNWNGSQDLLGLLLRKERYDEAFDTYFPFSDIKMNSPVKKAGILEGQFIIGCKQFKYSSNNQMLQNVYDRYFDKQVSQKTINLAVYNIKNDDLRIVPVLLARGWGDKGLLGCQFLQGHLNRFPKNIKQKREQILNKNKESQSQSKIKQQLSQSVGVSENLVESLKTQRNKRKNHLRNIKNILLIDPPKKNTIQAKQNQQILSQNKQIPINSEQGLVKSNIDKNESDARINILQGRVSELQKTIISLKEYIQKISDEDEL